jgi:hypothetical protein
MSSMTTWGRRRAAQALINPQTTSTAAMSVSTAIIVLVTVSAADDKLNAATAGQSAAVRTLRGTLFPAGSAGAVAVFPALVGRACRLRLAGQGIGFGVARSVAGLGLAGHAVRLGRLISRFAGILGHR